MTATEPLPSGAALQGVRKIYRMGTQEVRALDGVSATFARGSFWAIMGHSGSGKSTLLNLLGCLDRPTAGRYTLEGRDISQLTDDELSEIRLRKLGFIFQSFNLIPEMTVEENISLPLYYLGWDADRGRTRARELALRVGLETRLKHRPSELSGGQQQRVAIARALANDPAILLADEPTGNLDSATGADIMRLISDLNAQGRTVIMVTHETDVAAHARNRLHMKDGIIERMEGPQGMKQHRIIRNIELGVRTLLLHKLRSLLTMLGVVFGVGSVIAMLAVGEGASKEALAQIRKLGSHNIMLNAVKPVEEVQQRDARAHMSVYGLQYQDARRISECLPSVRRTVPVKIVRKLGHYGTRALELRVVGTTPAWFDLVQRPVLAGRVMLDHDQTDRRNVAVLTELGARRLLATEAIVGTSIGIGGGAFEVVGIVQNAGGASGAMQTPDQDVDAYVPLSVAKEHFGDVVTEGRTGSFTWEQVELHQMIVEVDATENVESTARALEAMLANAHKQKDYQINVPLALLRQAEATKRTFNIVLGSIAGISLLVGGIGIMNIMLASVTERTREIGIRRAIGAKRRQILGQFLIETIVLSTIGGIMGVGIGLLIPWAVSEAAGMPTVVTASSLLLSLGISMGVGIVFGIYPALRAARLDPIVALRHE